jgi:hypothetical protein
VRYVSPVSFVLGSSHYPSRPVLLAVNMLLPEDHADFHRRGWPARGHRCFVRQLRPELLETLEILDSAAVEALGLRLVAEQQRPTVGLARD